MSKKNFRIATKAGKLAKYWGSKKKKRNPFKCLSRYNVLRLDIDNEDAEKIKSVVEYKLVSTFKHLQGALLPISA